MKKTIEEHKINQEDLLLEMIQDLAEELHGSKMQQLTSNSDLMKDAGIDSLARIELLLRIDRTFGITLPEEDALNALTAGDLIKALIEASGKTAPDQDKPVQSASAPRKKLKSPENAQTLADILTWYNENFPDHEYIKFLPTGEEAEETLSYSQLYRGAERVSAGLLKGGHAPGKFTAIMLPTGFEYLFSFFGSILAGNIPVPIYPPTE